MSSTYVDGVTPLDAAHMNALQQKVEKAAANGYASLDSGGKVPLAQLPPVGADLIYDGDFSAGPTYKDGEIVVYQDASGNKVAYMCTSPTTTAPTPWPGGPPTVPAYPRPTYGTTLPASPVDGQEHILVDSVTNPSWQWHFRYNASSSSAYKWEFVGGLQAYAAITAVETTTTVGAWLNLATIGPQIIAPRAGEYLALAEIISVHSVATTTNSVGVAVNDGTPAVSGAGGVPSSNGYASVVAQPPRLTAAAGDALRVRYYNGAAGTASFQNRTLSVTPARVS